MSEPDRIAATSAVRPDVASAIAGAARNTGVDFSYLLAQARIESGLNPSARATSSSAAGLYQFTGATWLDTVKRHGGDHGLGWAQQAIAGGQAGDPAIRVRIMALRLDPDASAAMAAELAGDNAVTLRGVLGREPDATELYLAHFLGAEGASRFLAALSANPGQSAAALLPDAAGANRAIFYDADGARSLGEVMGVLRGKVEGAMDAGSAPRWGFGSRLEPRTSSEAARPAAPPRPSMADTLAAAFGGVADAPAPVRAAYGQLRALGL